jgi:formate/nitrite transporter FocA (FNT family)
MTANAIFGVIGTLLGGAACFCLGYHCALRWGAEEIDNTKGEAQK